MRLEADSTTSWARRRRPLITLTPLVDMVFILLIFFMLASNFTDWRTLEIITPGGVQGDPGQRLPVLIRLHGSGTLDVNGERVELADLRARTARWVASEKPYQFLIQPDEGVALQHTVAVIEVLSEVGARQISMVRRARE